MSRKVLKRVESSSEQPVRLVLLVLVVLAAAFAAQLDRALEEASDRCRSSLKAFSLGSEVLLLVGPGSGEWKPGKGAGGRRRTFMPLRWSISSSRSSTGGRSLESYVRGSSPSP